MSLGPGALPSLETGDKLQATGEVEVTTDCLEEGASCVGKPYTYNPVVQVRIVLANSQFTAAGVETLELGTQRLKCRQKLPDREHHCVIVFTDATLDIADRSQLPCSPNSCYLNMVVDAHSTRKPAGKKGRRNKLLIGENEPDGSVGTDKGRLNAIRFSPGDQPVITPLIVNTPLTTSVPIRKGEDVVLYSQELTGLRRNDQIAARAIFNASIELIPYNVLNRSRMILAPDPTATAPGKEVKELTEPKGEIAEANGFNCTQRNPAVSDEQGRRDHDAAARRGRLRRRDPAVREPGLRFREAGLDRAVRRHGSDHPRGRTQCHDLPRRPEGLAGYAPAAINTTPATANPNPSRCVGARRSPSTTRASSTVTAA